MKSVIAETSLFGGEVGPAALIGIFGLMALRYSVDLIKWYQTRNSPEAHEPGPCKSTRREMQELVRITRSTADNLATLAQITETHVTQTNTQAQREERQIEAIKDSLPEVKMRLQRIEDLQRGG